MPPRFFEKSFRAGEGIISMRALMASYEKVQAALKASPRTWLVTGVAGFIGSNLLEKLLKLDQTVIGLDNFSTGKQKNLEEVKAAVLAAQWSSFRFIEGDIVDAKICSEACAGVDFVLHQAALGSVPASIADPVRCHRANVTGFLTIITAARDAKVRRFVYASSSAVYGDEPTLPKVEERIGQPLSPYAASKWMDEVYAGVFARAYDISAVGLRYFNVFGPRQDPEGAYAAVIPKWAAALLRREPVQINGDGETSRDFCFVENVVQANILAATTENVEAVNQVYNIAFGERTSLNELFGLLQNGVRQRDGSLPETKPVYADFRAGDVRHSLADIGKAQRLLGYAPTHRMREGLELAMDWYCRNV
jgi:UDP-N-acetylglucosamine 4-epimerase